MRYIIMLAVLAAYLGAGSKHGFQITSVVFGTLAFLTFLTFALDSERGTPAATRPTSR